jgi:hypothetical protein
LARTGVRGDRGIRKNVDSVTFTVDSVTNTLTYDSAANHVPNGDGTRITIYTIVRSTGAQMPACTWQQRRGCNPRLHPLLACGMDEGGAVWALLPSG